MIFCNYCCNWIKGIYTQSHTQCELCTQIIDPCCAGEKGDKSSYEGKTNKNMQKLQLRKKVPM